MIIALVLVGFLALASGVLLLRRVPVCAEAEPSLPVRLSIIIPARNEERNLPRLLKSINSSTSASSATPEVIVVDDGSTDATVAVALAAGARVLKAPPLPVGWTGKTWACAQGAQEAQGNLLLFLDADTWFAPRGLDLLVFTWGRVGGSRVALSLLPFHLLFAIHEELSVFFNLLMAFGAGGFGPLGKPKLFGQCLMISRELYEASGGHAAVSSQILENLAMAAHIEAAGGRCVCLGGRGVLQVRMFPDGFTQLCESWKKAFTDGAAASDKVVLIAAIVWLTALCTLLLLLCIAPFPLRAFAAALYLLVAYQVFWFARQIGNFRWITALLYPIPMIFFFGLFASSLWNRMVHKQVMWRGRQL